MSEIQLSFTLNGKPLSLRADPGQRGLDLLRRALSHTGTKEGCGVGECGACTIVVNGEAVASCLLTAAQLQNAAVWTVEGLNQQEIGRVLQQCFVDQGAIQCGFCTPGMLMSAYALLCKTPRPSLQEVKTAIAGNLCRCTGYVPIIRAIQAASEAL